MTGPLDGIRILDLTRILAGPTCTQLLADMGADVIKVENPHTDGDDTRGWGPPHLADDEKAGLSTYFMAANRNKRSISLDLATAAGQRAVRRIAGGCDVLVENFRPGSLGKSGLDYDSLQPLFPRLVYCSISGFGQTGPNRDKPGYDLMAQGYGGIMSITGAPDGEPMKVGVGVSDVVCGLYAATSILAALRARDRWGIGQHIDIALVDCQVAWLVNEGVSYLNTGQLPLRRGNGHPNIAPYQVYQVQDGHVIIAVGNDGQFKRLASFLCLPELARDPRFATNSARVGNRDTLNDVLQKKLDNHTVAGVIAGLEAVRVPVGPVNDLRQVFESDQVRARDMAVEMSADTPGAETMRLIGNPVRFSRTPVSYRLPPPTVGAHTSEILAAFGDED